MSRLRFLLAGCYCGSLCISSTSRAATGSIVQAFQPERLPARLPSPYFLETTRNKRDFLVRRYFSLQSQEQQNQSRDAGITGGPSAVLSQKPSPTNATELQMLSFYHFHPLPDPQACRDAIFDAVRLIPGLRGTIYLAKEGINAQMAVPPGEALDDLLRACSTTLLEAQGGFDPFADLPPNMGDVVPASAPTFNRLIVRVRDYVLRDGIPADMTLDWADAGPELSPKEWHSDLSSSSSADAPLHLLDCRNLYESDEGTFKGAVPLGTDNFQESWGALEELTKDISNKDDPVHIFCTGGIRCVKVGAYMKQHLGFTNVKRLQHGIIGYQQWFDKEHPSQDEDSDESVWEGENFLFDKRRLEEKTGTEETTG